MSRVQTVGIDYTSKDYEAYRELLISKLQEKMPEYTDTSQTDAGIVILECLANGLDICSFYNDVVANDLLLPTTQDRRIAVILARNLGYHPYNQTASITPQVFVLNSVKDTDYLIGKGTIVRTEDNQDTVTIYFETMEDLIIPSGKLGNETDAEGNYLYQVNVQQGSSIKDDLLGSSKGTPYQSFKLNFPSALVDSINLYVNEGGGDSLWTKVDSLLDSTINESSKVYTVTIDEFDNCYVEFGNGVRGKIPSVFENGISANYRIGGGTIGNVQANTITVLETSLAFIDSTFNPQGSTTLGHEKEPIDEIRENAPASFRTRERAVTLKDYGDLLQIQNINDFYGVFKAKALRDDTNAMLVHLYYHMRENYIMTPTLEQEIQSFFSARTMIGTSLSLAPYTPYTVNIVASLVVDDDYEQATIKGYVDSYIKSTFFAFGNFSFDDEFILSDLETEVKKTFSGVRSLRITSPTGDIIHTTTGDQIIQLGTVTLNVTGGRV